MWHAPAAALRPLIVAAPTMIAAAAAPATPSAITMEAARPAAANGCPDTCLVATYPMTANATIADVEGA